MSGKIVNLRQTRKRKAREEKRATGHMNAARSGEAKSLRTLREAEADRTSRHLDDHRRETRDE